MRYWTPPLVLRHDPLWQVASCFILWIPRSEGFERVNMRVSPQRCRLYPHSGCERPEFLGEFVPLVFVVKMLKFGVWLFCCFCMCLLKTVTQCNSYVSRNIGIYVDLRYFST